jgi:hypothetical protein
MERELFAVIVEALNALPEAKRRPAKSRYSHRQVLAVAFWAALHDRPISWATQRRNWPFHDRTRPLPSNATMSRRLRDPVIARIVDLLIKSMWVEGHGARTLIVDGRPLVVATHSRDISATFGYGAGGKRRGYKLHAIVDLLGNCRVHRVEPLNVSEQVVAYEMIASLEHRAADLLLADGMYDVNKLYEIAGVRGIQMLAERRYKKAKGVGHQRHSEHRLRGLEIMKQDPKALDDRRFIESCFGTQGNQIGGLGPLPNHVRALDRVRRWVSLKVVIDAAHRKKRRASEAA